MRGAAKRLCHGAGRTHRGQGGRSGGGQGRRRGDDAGRGAGGRGRHVRRVAGCSRGRSGDRGIHGGRGGVVLCADRRRGRAGRSARRRTTSAPSTATTGPNTGGMGAYSPAPVLTDADPARRRWSGSSSPRCAEMARRGTPYQGVLYAGLMIEDGQRAAGRIQRPLRRSGMPGPDDADGRAGAGPDAGLRRGAAGGHQVNWADDHALTVVMAAQGYPGAYAKGSVDRRAGGAAGGFVADGVPCGDAGRRTAQVLANGGRVLNVTARGATLAEARDAGLCDGGAGSTGRTGSAAATSAGGRYRRSAAGRARA